MAEKFLASILKAFLYNYLYLPIIRTINDFAIYLQFLNCLSGKVHIPKGQYHPLKFNKIEAFYSNNFI